MHYLVTLPIFTAFALAGCSLVCFSDSRTRNLLHWIALPILVQGFLMAIYFAHIR